MKDIVALIDFSEVTADLIALAGDFAHATSAHLILLHVAMTNADFVDGQERVNVSREAVAEDLRDRRQKLDTLEQQVKSLGIQTSTIIVEGRSARGNPVETIVVEIDRLAPDLIVMGSHGRGRLYQLLVGSVTDAIFRKVRRPVLLVPSLSSPRNHMQPSP